MTELPYSRIHVCECVCISWVFITTIKCLRQIIYEGRRLILAQGFGGLTPRLSDSIGWASDEVAPVTA